MNILAILLATKGKVNKVKFYIIIWDPVLSYSTTATVKTSATCYKSLTRSIAIPDFVSVIWLHIAT